MAKRFTDSDKWKKPWFRRLPPALKCFWFYVLDNCNNAGIWEVDFDLASIHVGVEIRPLDTMEVFRKQYFPFALGKRWFIVDFVEFQYGDLKTSSNAHVAVINTLKKHGLYEIFLTRVKAEQDQHYENQPDSGVPRRVQEQEQEEEQDQAKDKDQDQDLDLKSKKDSIASDVPKESIDATRLTLLKAEFDGVRKSYPGTRGGLTVEWANFEKKNKGHLEEIIPLMGPAIVAEKLHKEIINRTRTDPLQWKHFTTWINKRCWEQELEAVNGSQNGGSRGHSGGYESAQQKRDKRLVEISRRGIVPAEGPGGVDHPALCLGPEGNPI